jgi:hypothetical protein
VAGNIETILFWDVTLVLWMSCYILVGPAADGSTCFFETLVCNCQTTWCHIPEVCYLLNTFIVH